MTQACSNLLLPSKRLSTGKFLHGGIKVVVLAKATGMDVHGQE